ncbi:tRNA 5-methoxyuridine(34)/uridine 5-oxyacetic acid(34) synthase CmoB [Desulforhopalus singaporensis]|uniref:tRNA (Mo5U34)-methyltransferase n=1 Tax=Desulforhopalus singaporensis TaxID=91360 RepID=A0A1H0NEE0_9BACT|nr:tRNA 5-methoxyuridine(34)/uridine 5-oxyacetic acid(34) synthase CmoB [Desulforhopalus singaporensis]SDO90785.1 tRNA (mo5U34)-methyltransferase [Desulforhopalus singaporensis]
MTYFPLLPPSVQIDAIEQEHLKKQQWVGQDKKGFLRYRTPYLALSRHQATSCNCAGDTVTIGAADEIDDAGRAAVKENLRAFMPWRKGPFSIFGIDVDAEWRSDKKWRRIVPELPELKDKMVADIGCNNGYYMFRMTEHAPRFVLGFEPSVQHYYCFKALNAMAGCSNLDIDLLGVEHLHLFANCFDVVFLMGIIYHRPSPIDTLRDIVTALAPGGTLILETQAIPGEEPYALFPQKTYAKVPGTYFVPTALCLINWMEKAGFTDISFFSSSRTTPEEQRKTEWMQFESLTDFLDPHDPTLTIEGYPAPLRIIVKGRKKIVK